MAKKFDCLIKYILAIIKEYVDRKYTRILYYCLSTIKNATRLLVLFYYYILSTDLYKHSAQFLLLRGRCLNVAPEFSQTAEECLSRAVKLEPGLVEGWNTLGEQYWKKGDLTAANTCFTGAQQQVSLYYSQEQWVSFIKCAYMWYNQ